MSRGWGGGGVNLRGRGLLKVAGMVLLGCILEGANEERHCH